MVVLVIMSMFMIVRVLVPVFMFMTSCDYVQAHARDRASCMFVMHAYVRVCVLRSWLHHPFK